MYNRIVRFIYNDIQPSGSILQAYCKIINVFFLFLHLYNSPTPTPSPMPTLTIPHPRESIS